MTSWQPAALDQKRSMRSSRCWKHGISLCGNRAHIPKKDERDHDNDEGRPGKATVFSSAERVHGGSRNRFVPDLPGTEKTDPEGRKTPGGDMKNDDKDDRWRSNMEYIGFVILLALLALVVITYAGDAISDQFGQ
jgi:hypothetical protein